MLGEPGSGKSVEIRKESEHIRKQLGPGGRIIFLDGRTTIQSDATLERFWFRSKSWTDWQVEVAVTDQQVPEIADKRVSETWGARVMAIPFPKITDHFSDRKEEDSVGTEAESQILTDESGSTA